MKASPDRRNSLFSICNNWFSRFFRPLPPVPSLFHWVPNHIPSVRRTVEGIIASGALGGFLTQLDPEEQEKPHNCEETSLGFGWQAQSEVVAVGMTPAAMTGSPSVSPGENRVEPKTATSTGQPYREPAQPAQEHVNPAVWCAPSPYQRHGEPEIELNTGVTVSSGADVVHGGGTFAGLGAFDTTSTLPGFREMGGPTSDAGEDDLAAADWLEVTQAMLDAVEDMDRALR